MSPSSEIRAERQQSSEPLFPPTPESVEVATKVFGTAELLEHVLFFLDARSVLRAQQVSRIFRDTIESSKKIQKAIGLIPDYDADFHFPLWPEDGLTFQGLKSFFDIDNVFLSDEFSLPPVTPSIWSTVAAVYLHRKHLDTTLKPMGSRCRALSVCQPPLKSNKLHAARCEPHSGNPADGWRYVEVAPERGYVTLGDLQDAAKDAISYHESYCESTTAPCCGDIEFEGYVDLREDDTAVIRRKEIWKEEERHHLECAAAETASL